jgi:hypothetical protein
MTASEAQTRATVKATAAVKTAKPSALPPARQNCILKYTLG